MTNSAVVAFPLADRWYGVWHGDIGRWLLTSGLRIALLIVGAMLVARFMSWSAQRFSRRIGLGLARGDALVLSESAKHRQAVARVISWVAIALLFILVGIEVIDILNLPIAGLVAPAAVLGAALGFGAQKVVQDLLAGFFIIVEKQYGIGDLVQLSVTGAKTESRGTVEEVTLRVTKLRNAEGEMFSVPNGNIVRSLNLSKEWARAVIDVPVPTDEDLDEITELLTRVCQDAQEDPELNSLLLDRPAVLGVESIELDAMNVRVMVHTLPGKQFEVGRRMRKRVIAALQRAGIGSPVGPALVASAGDDQLVVGVEKPTQRTTEST